MKKKLSLLLTFAMLLSLMTVPAAAAAPPGNWYDEAMSTWALRGVILGDEKGDLNPAGNLTRAELAVMLERIMGYRVKAGGDTYTDVRPGDWFADAVLKASAAGILQGDGSAARPGDTITRQEAAVILARVLGLSGSTGGTAFSDESSIAPWALESVKAMASRGYIQGSNGLFRPNAPITRAEVLTILSNMFKGYYDKAGGYTSSVEGDAVINAPGVTLTGMRISGDLIVAEAVGDGSVTLDGVSLGGRLIVRGGGEHSIVIKGGSTVGSVVVARRDGKVRVSVEGGADVEMIHVDDGSDAVKIEGAVGAVSVTGADASVEITGTVERVEVAESAAGAALTVADGAKVDTLTVAAPKGETTVAGAVKTVKTGETAEGSSVIVSRTGAVEAMTNAAPEGTVAVAGTVSKLETTQTAANTAIVAEKGATVKEVVVNSEGTAVGGDAEVGKVSVNADNVQVGTPNTTVHVGEGVKNVTNGDKTLHPGQANTTGSKPVDVTTGSGTSTGSISTGDKKPDDSKPSGGGSSGGGGGHQHAYIDGVCPSDGAIDPSAAQAGTAEALNAALADTRVSTIVLTASFETSGPVTVTRGLTLNLNGKTLTSSYTSDAAPFASVTVSGASGALRISDTSGGKLTTAAAGGNTVMAQDKGSLTLVKGTIENTAAGRNAVRAQDGAVNIEGGTVSGTEGYGVAIFGTAGNAVTVSGGIVEGKLIGISSMGTRDQCENYTISITGGTVRNTNTSGTDDNAAIYLPGTGGNTTISGNAVINGGRIGIAIRTGALTIDGGTVTASAARNGGSPSLVSGQTGSYTGALVVGKPSSTSANGYVGDITVAVNGGILENKTAGGDVLCVVHENKSGVPAAGAIAVDLKGSAALTGGMNIQDGFGTVSGDRLTLDGGAYVFSSESLVKALQAGGNITLGRDIALTFPGGLFRDVCITEHYTGVLDGRGHAITTANTAWKALIAFAQGACVIKNLTMEYENQLCTLVVENQGNLTLENVALGSTHSADKTVNIGNNDSGFCSSNVGGASLVFRGCTNNMNYEVDGGGYAAIFLGGMATSTDITFENCVNNGDMNGKDVALFIGNPTNAGKTNPAAVTVTNCENNGTLTGSASAAFFSTLKGSDVFDALNRSVTVGGSGALVQSADGKTTIALGQEGSFTVARDGGAAAADRFLFQLSAYSSSSDGSTWLVTIGKQMSQAGDTGLKPGTFISRDDFDVKFPGAAPAPLSEAVEVPIGALAGTYTADGGALYYVFESIGGGSAFSFGENGAAPKASVDVFNAAGVIIDSAAYAPSQPAAVTEEPSPAAAPGDVPAEATPAEVQNETPSEVLADPPSQEA